MHKKNILIEIPSPLITALVNSDWAHRGGARNPGKLSLLLLGSSLIDSKSHGSDKASLTL